MYFRCLLLSISRATCRRLLSFLLSLSLSAVRLYPLGALRLCSSPCCCIRSCFCSLSLWRRTVFQVCAGSFPAVQPDRASWFCWRLGPALGHLHGAADAVSGRRRPGKKGLRPVLRSPCYLQRHKLRLEDQLFRLGEHVATTGAGAGCKDVKAAWATRAVKHSTLADHSNLSCFACFCMSLSMSEAVQLFSFPDRYDSVLVACSFRSSLLFSETLQKATRASASKIRAPATVPRTFRCAAIVLSLQCAVHFGLMGWTWEPQGFSWRSWDNWD